LFDLINIFDSPPALFLKYLRPKKTPATATATNSSTPITTPMITPVELDSLSSIISAAGDAGKHVTFTETWLILKIELLVAVPQKPIRPLSFE
jgi:hypothetical protein